VSREHGRVRILACRRSRWSASPRRPNPTASPAARARSRRSSAMSPENIALTDRRCEERRHDRHLESSRRAELSASPHQRKPRRRQKPEQQHNPDDPKLSTDLEQQVVWIPVDPVDSEEAAGSDPKHRVVCEQPPGLRPQCEPAVRRQAAAASGSERKTNARCSVRGTSCAASMAAKTPETATSNSRSSVGSPPHREEGEHSGQCAGTGPRDPRASSEMTSTGMSNRGGGAKGDTSPCEKDVGDDDQTLGALPPELNRILSSAKSKTGCRTAD